MLEVHIIDQVQYDSGMRRLRELATASQAGRKDMAAFGKELAEGHCPHLSGRGHKPETYALFKETVGTCIDQFAAEIAQVIPYIVSSARGKADFDTPFKQVQAAEMAFRGGLMGAVEPALQGMQEGAPASHTEKAEFWQDCMERANQLTRDGNVETSAMYELKGQVQEGREAISIALAALQNAIQTTKHDILIVPGIFAHQFGREITEEEFTEIVDGLMEFELLQAALHFQIFMCLRMAYLESPMIGGPSSVFVIGKNKHGKLRMGYRPGRFPDHIWVAASLGSMPVGCALISKVRQLFGWIKDLVVPLIPADDEGAMKSFREDVARQLEANLKSADSSK